MTQLSKYVWDLNDKEENYKIKWEIIQKATPLKCGAKVCQLCLSEKFHILTHKGNNLLNTKNEVISTCRHRKKFLLSSVK